MGKMKYANLLWGVPVAVVAAFIGRELYQGSTSDRDSPLPKRSWTITERGLQLALIPEQDAPLEKEVDTTEALPRTNVQLIFLKGTLDVLTEDLGIDIAQRDDYSGLIRSFAHYLTDEQYSSDAQSGLKHIIDIGDSQNGFERKQDPCIPKQNRYLEEIRAVLQKKFYEEFERYADRIIQDMQSPDRCADETSTSICIDTNEIHMRRKDLGDYPDGNIPVEEIPVTSDFARVLDSDFGSPQADRYAKGRYGAHLGDLASIDNYLLTQLGIIITPPEIRKRHNPLPLLSP
jgi:hypothetical protein